MKKYVYLTIVGIMFLFVGTINVKAYDVSSLSSTDVNVSINKLVMHLYDMEKGDPYYGELAYTFELPMGENGFSITNDTLTNTNFKIDASKSINMKLVELDTNFATNNISQFISEQNIDKTKYYFGDITAEYSINNFPSTYSLFTKVNSYGYIMHKYPILSESANDYTPAAMIPASLNTEGTFSTSQILNVFSYYDASSSGEEIDSDYEALEMYEDVSGEDLAPIFAFNYGVFSSGSEFNIENPAGEDSAIMFSIVSGMKEYLQTAQLSTLGDDIASEMEGDDETSGGAGSSGTPGSSHGHQIVAVGNTAATESQISLIIGLLLVISGSFLVSKLIKRYN